MGLFGPTMFALSRCHYCTSHWLALAVVAACRPQIVGVWWLDLLVAWFALVGMAALISGLIMFFTPFNSEK